MECCKLQRYYWPLSQWSRIVSHPIKWFPIVWEEYLLPFHSIAPTTQLEEYFILWRVCGNYIHSTTEYRFGIQLVVGSIVIFQFCGRVERIVLFNQQQNSKGSRFKAKSLLSSPSRMTIWCLYYPEAHQSFKCRGLPNANLSATTAVTCGCNPLHYLLCWWYTSYATFTIQRDLCFGVEVPPFVLI